VFTAIWGGFEGAAAMGGVSVGLPLGALLGFALGLWLALRRGGRSAGPAFLWMTIVGLVVLGVGALIVLTR
jgi:hypothetical protein